MGTACGHKTVFEKGLQKNRSLCRKEEPLPTKNLLLVWLYVVQAENVDHQAPMFGAFSLHGFFEASTLTRHVRSLVTCPGEMDWELWGCVDSATSLRPRFLEQNAPKSVRFLDSGKTVKNLAVGPNMELFFAFCRTDSARCSRVLGR